MADLPQVRVRLDRAQMKALAGALGVDSLSRIAKDTIEDVLSKHQSSRAALKGQKIGTTPTNVKAALSKLRNALEPFLSPEGAIDSDTYDALHEPCARLHQIVAIRLDDLRKHPKIRGTVSELNRVSAPLLRLTWESHAAEDRKADPRARRRFVSLALDIIGAHHPDPEKHLSDLDRLIESDPLT